MSPNFLIAAMGVQCAIACVLFLYQGNQAMALTFFGYTIANGGLLWAAIQLAS
jgi:hypothetical protein